MNNKYIDIKVERLEYSQMDKKLEILTGKVFKIKEDIYNQYRYIHSKGGSTEYYLKQIIEFCQELLE